MPLAAELQPFRVQAGAGARPSALQLLARAERSGAELQLSYALSGPVGLLAIPPLAPSPQRRDGLWQHTCLEAFLAVGGQEPYWELNLAPAGHWNLYRLDGYRRNLRADGCLSALPMEVEGSANSFGLRATLPLPPDLAAAAQLDLALTAVLKHRDGGLSYWALAHPPAQPDFHWRGGWRRCH
ncbi:MAG: DOMON-like domain-containing protein [Cyanobacteria bacterium J06638_7]